MHLLLELCQIPWQSGGGNRRVIFLFTDVSDSFLVLDQAAVVISRNFGSSSPSCTRTEPEERFGPQLGIEYILGLCACLPNSEPHTPEPWSGQGALVMCCELLRLYRSLGQAQSHPNKAPRDFLENGPEILHSLRSGGVPVFLHPDDCWRAAPDGKRGVRNSLLSTPWEATWRGRRRRIPRNSSKGDGVASASVGPDSQVRSQQATKVVACDPVTSCNDVALHTHTHTWVFPKPETLNPKSSP